VTSTPPRSRRSDILVAAEREFASAGFSGARVERIAAAAGVNKQLLFHYFGSKEGLFAAALDVLLARLEPTHHDTGSPVEELRSMLATLQDAALERPGLVGIVADACANPDFPRGPLDSLRSWLDRVRTRLGDVIAEGQRRGYFRDDIDPAAIAQLGLGAALGAGALGRDHGAPVATFIADHCAWR